MADNLPFISFGKLGKGMEMPHLRHPDGGLQGPPEAGGRGTAGRGAGAKVALSGASVSLAPGGVTVTAGDISGAFILPGTGVAGKLQVRTLSVTGVTGLTLNVDQFYVEVNTTGGAVSAVVNGQNVVFTAAQGQYLSVVGTLTNSSLTVGALSLGISGRFGFEKTTLTVNGNPNASVIKFFAEGATVSLTAGPVIVTASTINGGFILQAPGVIDATSPGGIAVYTTRP